MTMKTVSAACEPGVSKANPNIDIIPLCHRQIFLRSSLVFHTRLKLSFFVGVRFAHPRFSR
jgi:hypothetical protein